MAGPQAATMEATVEVPAVIGAVMVTITIGAEEDTVTAEDTVMGEDTVTGMAIEVTGEEAAGMAIAGTGARGGEDTIADSGPGITGITATRTIVPITAPTTIPLICIPIPTTSSRDFSFTYTRDKAANGQKGAGLRLFV